MDGSDVSGAMDAFTATDYPLYVVTVGTGAGERSGCVAGFVTQCSIVPARFLVCISKVNHTFVVAERAEGMALHLLGSDQMATARLFAEESGDTTDKFAHCRWRPGPHHAPVLTSCAAWLEGVAIGHQSVGDHQAYLFRPETGGRGPNDGLLTLADAPDLHPAHPA
jgi:flavin reductase (DIM6/NTAB) family NADH-FMN oxidoreductase RutF